MCRFFAGLMESCIPGGGWANFMDIEGPELQKPIVPLNMPRQNCPINSEKVVWLLAKLDLAREL